MDNLISFDTVCKAVALKYPFYGNLLSQIEKIPNTNVEGIVLGRDNLNKYILVYNPKLFKTLPLDESEPLLLSSLKSLVLGHLVLN